MTDKGFNVQISSVFSSDMEQGQMDNVSPRADKKISPERFKTTKKVTFGMSSTFTMDQQSKSSKVGAYDNFKIYNDTSSDDLGEVNFHLPLAFNEHSYQYKDNQTTYVYDYPCDSGNATYNGYVKKRVTSEGKEQLLQHGEGTQVWKDKSKYVGAWKDGKIHGRGTFNYANGDVY